MSDIHETLLDNYEEAMDMGMSIAEAMKWAKEKTHGYVDHGDIKLSEVDILKRNVADLQQELHEAQIKIKNQREVIESITKVMTMKQRDPSWKWLRALGHKIVLATKGKMSYTRKVKHKKVKEIE